MKQKKVVKKLIIFGVVVALVFAVINLVWFLGIKVPYDNLSNGMEKIQGPTVDGFTRIYHTASKDGYEFNIKNRKINFKRRIGTVETDLCDALIVYMSNL